MAAVPPLQLVNAILDAVQDSGETAVFVSSLRSHPRRFIITRPDGASEELWVYGWTLTHGGRPQLPHEYRIQMTSVTSPLPMNPDGPTALIGYEPNVKMFAGFDLARHRTFKPGSPSVQIDMRAIQRALQNGIAFDRKDNKELAIAFQPSQFLNYVRNSTALHQFGGRAASVALLERTASRVRIRRKAIEALTRPRQRVIQTVARIARSANFREQVMFAYGMRCAVTKIQMRLVDAAHILPVGDADSIDHICNGIALSPTYHRAFDNGLIYLDTAYRMRLNPSKESQLQAIGLVGGLANLKQTLGPIVLPPDKRQWPDPSFIRKANEYRNIP